MEALHSLTASEAAAGIRAGKLLPSELVQAALDRVDHGDPSVRAWVCVDRRGAGQEARTLDAEARAGRWRGPLHGVPVGLKDIYDAVGLTTTAGAFPGAHRQPVVDAECVGRLRRAGAVILGKTTTTEFAFLDPAETRNPWNLNHTPGGSSSGSAAAVAARMIPLALGSQTVGSTLRPAAFCGVVGFKPSFARISCRGMVPLARGLDHVGILCRSVADAALAFEVLADENPGGGRSAGPAGPPRLGLVRQFYFENASAEVSAHVEEVARRLGQAGAVVRELALPPGFRGLHEAGALVLAVEAAVSHAELFPAHAAEYRPGIRALIERGLAVRAVDYANAQVHLKLFREEMLSQLQAVDAILVPPADSTAPEGLSSTGNPSFCAPWSFAGLPAIALPSGLSSDGLPLGVQLVSALLDEQRLLKTALWCESILSFRASPPEEGGATQFSPSRRALQNT